MLHLIGVKCVSRALWASCVYTFAALKEVSSAKRSLIGVDDTCQPIIEPAASSIKAANFCEFDRRENEAATLLVITTVLIDSA
eukprot:scaffold2056_cov78-Skeletonema_dohrnii-CCMP3373.AAC.1